MMFSDISPVRTGLVSVPVVRTIQRDVRRRPGGQQTSMQSIRATNTPAISRSCRLYNDTEQSLLINAAFIGPDRLSLTVQGKGVRNGVKETMPSVVGIDVVGDDRTTRT